MTSLSDEAVLRLREAVDRPSLPDRFELVEVIGRGGMGVVWHARDLSLGRDVAIKVVAPYLTDPSFSARLRREARILARLEHPAIVPIYDVGILEDESVWYVMRLVRGTRLDVVAANGPGRGELLRTVERLCEAVAYAHAHQVLHRDLKPANVMLGPFGEVIVLDWGVARDANWNADGGSQAEIEDSDGSTGHPAEVITRTGTVIGTPGYMPPEQEAGGIIDERADVYGLGAILRDLCAVHADPVPRSLAAIRDRAIASLPEDRYPSAIALRDDIRRFLDGERVLAYKENFLESTRRLAAVHRVPILLIGAYLVVRLAFLFWRRL
jgi:serine/threonine protein kinase